MLQLDQIHNALGKLNGLNSYEITFDVGAVSITLRPLTSIEEMEVQNTAARYLVDVEGEVTREQAAVEYIERFKLACLSYSIVKIDNLYLGDSEFVATGEKTAQGTPVRIKRHEAVSQVIGKWPRPTLTTIFRKFGEMIEKMEIAVEKAIEFDPPDLDVEISRLKDRIETLERLKEQRIVGQTEVEEKGAEGDVDIAAEEGNTSDLSGSNESAPVSNTAPQNSVRESIIPQTVPPITRAQTTEVKEEIQVSEAQESATPVDTPVEGKVETPQNVDPLSEEAMQAEHRRMMEMRARRKPPHMAARNVNHQMNRSKPVQEGSMKVGGEDVPVFRMPAQNLSNRPEKPTNQREADSTVNPNYRPRKKR